MTHKTIKIKDCKTCKEVHIFLDRNDNGEYFVRTIAWHEADGNLLIQSAETDVCKSDCDLLMMRRYIADFSVTSAHEFVNSFDF